MPIESHGIFPTFIALALFVASAINGGIAPKFLGPCHRCDYAAKMGYPY
jgi:hypothetical protein